MLLTLLSQYSGTASSWSNSWSKSWGDSWGYKISLEVSKSTHAHITDGDLLLTQANTLVLDDTIHSHTVDGDFIFVEFLTLDKATHAHTVDGDVELTQANVLALDGSDHSHVADEIELVGEIPVLTDSASHDHLADGDLILVQANQLITEESLHNHLADGDSLLVQANNIVIDDALHNHLADTFDIIKAEGVIPADSVLGHIVDEIGYFVITELRLVGLLTDVNGLVTDSGLQLIVFEGTDIYSYDPILQSSSISITDGQIGIRSSAFRYQDVGSDYLVVIYDLGPPLKGGGPHPATVVDINA